MSNIIKRTERGWAAHFCLARNCRFRRNTLLEYGETRIVVSTVGRCYLNLTGRDEDEIEHDIGCDRAYETMAFHAEYDGTYWDACISQQVDFKSNWSLTKESNDNEANDMHEAVVFEISNNLINGIEYMAREEYEDE